MITVRRKIGEALALAPLPLAVADVEVNMHWAGYSLVSVWWDLHNKSILKIQTRYNKIFHFYEIRQLLIPSENNVP